MPTKTKEPGRPRKAAKDRASDLIKVRVTAGKKGQYQRAAKRSKKALSKWIVEKLDSALAAGG